MIKKLTSALQEFTRGSAISFVVLFGFVSLFADMTYEGARSIMGPYLKLLGGSAAAWAGVIVWGIGMGWQESIMRSVISDMAPHGRRASAFGVFNAGYGIMWFAGSWALGSLYDLSATRGLSLTVPAFLSVAVQLAAVPVYIYISHRGRR